MSLDTIFVVVNIHKYLIIFTIFVVVNIRKSCFDKIALSLQIFKIKWGYNQLSNISNLGQMMAFKYFEITSVNKTIDLKYSAIKSVD